MSFWLVALALALPPALEEWRLEIERTGGTPVLVAEVEFSADGQEMRLPEGIQGRALFASYLRQEDFVRQFLLMRGVMVHHQGFDGQAYLVMLNGARRGEWGGHEAALIGHEFGHAWLRAKGYPAPVYQAGAAGCLAIHTGDIVQHVLIRREMERRGIGHTGLWIESLEAGLRGAQTWGDGEGTRRGREGDTCLALRQVAEWVDVRLGLAAAGWRNFVAYEEEMRRVFPGLEETVGAVTGAVLGREVADPTQHRAALERVYGHLQALAREMERPDAGP